MSEADLGSIGWARCCATCPYFSTHSDVESHRRTCDSARAEAASNAQEGELSKEFEYTATHQMLIDSCPPANREDLKKRIREGENIANLFSLVGAWLTPPAPAAGKGP